jgi:hypothetical protein
LSRRRDQGKSEGRERERQREDKVRKSAQKQPAKLGIKGRVREE